MLVCPRFTGVFTSSAEGLFRDKRQAAIEQIAIDSTAPYHEMAIKIAVSLGTGLLVGLEREWAQKEVGVRTFAITTLTGTIASMLGGQAYIVAALAGVFLLVGLLNVQSMLKDRSLELTTSAALMVMVMLGALVGEGQYFMAAAPAIIITMLLAWKFELAKFADALLPEEIRGAVLLGLLSFVIYPLLPDRYVDPYNLINPRQAWVTVVVIAGIGFVNYVLLRLYSTRGLYYAALLGGLVNSTAAVAELSGNIRNQEDGIFSGAIAVLLLTNVAMFLRNVVLLGIFAKSAVPTALMPLAAMAMLAILFTWLSRDRSGAPVKTMQLSSPVSLMRVGKFGILFVCLAATGSLAQRYFGSNGFLLVSIAGGLISSASTTATAAALAAAGQISPETAGIATVLTSISSAVINVPLVYQQTHRLALTRRLALTTGVITCAGLAVLGVAALVRAKVGP